MDGFFWSMIFGVVGMAYFVYGKNNARLYPLLFGLALCVFPYFVEDVTLMVVIGVALSAAPWFLRSDS